MWTQIIMDTYSGNSWHLLHNHNKDSQLFNPSIKEKSAWDLASITGRKEWRKNRG